MTKIEDLTDAELDVLVAEKVMDWSRGPGGVSWFTKENNAVKDWFQVCAYVRTEYWWQPSTNIACAFEVDKPEWEWRSDELGSWYAGGWRLRLGIWDDGEYLADITILLDPANKTAAYCRGRCIAALKACGVTEV